MDKFVSIGVMCLYFLLTGCSTTSGPQEKLRTYFNQIKNLSSGEVADDSEFQSELWRYPQKRSLLLPTTDLRIGVFDYLALKKCDLEGLIAERNSILGKVMPVSRLLHWEQRFFAQLTKCRVMISADSSENEELLSMLDSLYAIKKRDLSTVFWNATFASPEFQRLFSLATGPLEMESSSRLDSRLNEALDFFGSIGADLSSDSLMTDISQLEDYYQVIQSKRYASALLLSIELLTFYLQLSADFIESHFKQDSSIADDYINAYMDIFREQYGPGIQPYLSLVYQNGEKFLATMNRLYDSQSIEAPDSFKNYFRKFLSMDEKTGLWQKFEDAIASHNAAWQKLLDKSRMAG